LESQSGSSEKFTEQNKDISQMGVDLFRPGCSPGSFHPHFSIFGVIMNEGKKFEEDFRKSIPDNVWFYRFRDGTSNWNNQDQTLTRFQAMNICDCMIFSYPFLYLIELKSHNSASLPFSAIRNNQISDLSTAGQYKGIIPLVIINMRKYGKTYAVHIDKIKYYINHSNRKSIPISWMKDNGVEVIGEQKRVRWKYDIEKLIS
jgi:recombination protein U